MAPELVEKYRAARELLLAIRTASAKEVKHSWAELFEKPIELTKGRSRVDLADEISRELQTRLKRAVGSA